MTWLWLSLAILLGVPVLVGLVLVVLYFHILGRYADFLVRVFKDKPLFLIPRGQPIDEAEDVQFKTADGLTLRGCYLPARTGPRRGVILFGLEFGSNRWSCVPYCQTLLENGYDVFAFESRGQGDSEVQPGYDPLHWVTDYEVIDVEAALDYLKHRPDADPRGIGFFGISKGGSAGLIAASRAPEVRCFVTDGVFATRATMIPYMQKWVAIVSTRYWLQRLLPAWYYGFLAEGGLRRIHKENGCRYPRLKSALRWRLRRPLLMIHGGADSYIKPDMARKLFATARGPKELWIVEGAKHNQALHVAGEEYGRRILAFFNEHLADPAVLAARPTRVDQPAPVPAAPVPALPRTPRPVPVVEGR